MARHGFSGGTEFRWNGVVYRVQSIQANTNQVVIQNVSTEAISVECIQELMEALYQGDLSFVIVGRHAQLNRISLPDYKLYLAAVALYRRWIILPVLGSRPREELEKRVREVKSIVDSGNQPWRTELVEHGIFLDQKSEEKFIRKLSKLSTDSIYRWRRYYAEAQENVCALIPHSEKCGGRGKRRLNLTEEDIIQKTIDEIYLVPERATIDDVFDEIATKIAAQNSQLPEAEHLRMPHRATVGRRVADLNRYQVTVIKRGEHEANRESEQYDHNEYPDIPLHTCQYDDTRLDIIVIDDKDDLPIGRPTLALCEELSARYPLGYYMGFEPPSYLTVMACLYHSILPKPNVRELYGTQNGWDAHGVMWRLIVDRARQLSGHDLKDACNGLGIILIPAPPREPQFKAEVEAEIKAMNYMLFHKLPGTTFANPKQRGRYDSMGTACVYVSEIDKAMHTFICDIVTQRKHRGINAVPAQRWKRLTSDPNFVWPLPPDAGTLEILLSRVAQRSLQHYGFDLFGLRYNCPDLGALRAELPKRESIRIKYRPDDMGHVWVYNRFNGSYIKVPANHQEYAQHLSLYKHRVLRKAAQELEGSVDHVALGRAKRKLREIVQQGRDRKATSTRTRQKRLETNGRPTRELSSESTVDTPANAQGNATSPQTSTEPVAPRLPPGVTSISDIQLDRVPEGWSASNSLPSQRVEGSEKPPREEASEPAIDAVQPQNQESAKPVEPARSAPDIQLDGVPEGWGVSKPKSPHSSK